MLSKVYHPNVYDSGRICLDVIQSSKWSPAASMEARVFNIILLLQEPNPNSPANGSAASTWEQGPAAMRDAVMRYYQF